MTSLPNIGRAQQEQRARQEADLDRRRHGKNLLSPDLLRPGVKSAVGVLMTTLGGTLRPVTAADLVRFRQNIKQAGGALAQGLTRQELIDASRPEDLERARQQIRQAVPTRLTQGDVLFVTNAGPDSRVHRHVVHLVFANYAAAVARPETPLQAALWLTSEGRMRFECTCERFTFFYRYLATISSCVAGRFEHSFPKIRNPDLAGMGCKHLLRVAHELGGPFARRALARMIESDRKQLHAKQAPARPRVITTSRDHAAEVLRRQANRPSAIRTTEEQHRRAVIAGIKAALPKRAAGATRADLNATLARLQARSDVSAAAILQALQRVLQQPARR